MTPTDPVAFRDNRRILNVIEGTTGYKALEGGDARQRDQGPASRLDNVTDEHNELPSLGALQ